MNITGITRSDEEKHLSDTIEVTQNNLNHVLEEIKTLTEDTENFMFEANKSKDKAILTLWNNVRAQLNESKNWLIRAEKARKKPYFGRIDFRDLAEKREESYYIGRVGVSKSPTQPWVIDWRAPVASLYYDNGLGKGTYSVNGNQNIEVDLSRKRTYEIESDRLKDFYDMDVVSNDELLTRYLSKNKSEVLGEIIATIQKEQNRIIRRSPKTNVIVQGVAGSGKTTVAMHRISYILFNYAEDFRPEDFYIIGSNQILLNYITGVLPELDVYGAKQMTMEQLFIRLLYEDWNAKEYTVTPLDKKNGNVFVKGTGRWFKELEEFCKSYEKSQIRAEDIYLDRYDICLLKKERITAYIEENPLISLQSKRLMLNEILYAQYENYMSGRHARFTAEEKKELDKKYATWFAKWGKYGKADWDGSIYELYQEFLVSQNRKGYQVPIPEKAFDVYDLAALAYLYKRIKETDPIREATHVVIDEAQDFGMMAYQSLHYCMRGCTYTIMGDTSQNIHYQYGLNDWEELKDLILTGVHDFFGTLKKSYRNTVEISEFATEILRHGDFSIYPVEPIIRHGNPVSIEECKATGTLVNRAVETIENWQQQGYETIAVVCRDEEETAKVAARLKKKITIKEMDKEDAAFGNGVMVLPVSYTKGLEFDAVLIWDPDQDKYPEDNGNVKMLYVASTRALHELSVLYIKRLTSLIAEKAPEEKHLKELQAELPLQEKEIVPKISEREKIEQQKADAIREMAERSYLGPQRIQAIPIQKEKTGIAAAKPNTNVVQKPAAAPKAKQPVTEGDAPVNVSPYKYNEIPATQALSVKGHMRTNTAVKWVKKTKESLEITSSYGVLVLTPISENCIHIQFQKGLEAVKKESIWNTRPVSGLKWNARESSTVIELATKQIVIRIEKRDGALRFLTGDRKPLLSENTTESRLIEGKETWNFFEFDRSDKIKSKGPLKDDFTDITNKARYISKGGRRLHMPFLLSNKGYALGIASEKTVLFNGIRTYGPYIYTEGNGAIDYYFMYGKSNEKNTAIYYEL